MNPTTQETGRGATAETGVGSSALFRISDHRQALLNISTSAARVSAWEWVQTPPSRVDVLIDLRWPFLLCPSELSHPTSDVRYWQILHGRPPQALQKHHDPILKIDTLFEAAPPTPSTRLVPFPVLLIHGLLWHIRQEGRSATAAIQYDDVLWLAIADDAGQLRFLQRFPIDDDAGYYLALPWHLRPGRKSILYAGGDLTPENIREDHPHLQAIYSRIRPFGTANWWEKAPGGTAMALHPFGALLLCEL